MGSCCFGYGNQLSLLETVLCVLIEPNTDISKLASPQRCCVTGIGVFAVAACEDRTSVKPRDTEH
jgi:hypothetical protein